MVRCSAFHEGPDDFWLATDAYIYGYPLVTMEMTRRVITNVAAPEGTEARWVRSSSCANIRMRRFGTSPRRMPTRFTPPSFFDVGKEPWVLSIPDMKDRYYLMPMLDGWTDVFQVPGKRTTGTGARPTRSPAPAGRAHCRPA